MSFPCTSQRTSRGNADRRAPVVRGAIGAVRSGQMGGVRKQLASDQAGVSEETLGVLPEAFKSATHGVPVGQRSEESYQRRPLIVAEKQRPDEGREVRVRACAGI